MEYKATKIKGAVKLHCNEDPAIQTCGTLKSRVSKWDRGLRLKMPLGSRGSLVSNLISSISVHTERGTHSRYVIGCCLIPLGICGLKNNSRRITYGIGCVWRMPSLSPLSSLVHIQGQKFYAAPML